MLRVDRRDRACDRPDAVRIETQGDGDLARARLERGHGLVERRKSRAALVVRAEHPERMVSGMGGASGSEHDVVAQLGNRHPAEMVTPAPLPAMRLALLRIVLVVEHPTDQA